MAFWGVEVKPGKPYTHRFTPSGPRLRISQATLAIGSSLNKSLVQCNVGDKGPVLICALLPDKTESLQLDLEFEEAEDVIFSVIGPRGVHLSGYYVGNNRHSNMQDDTESYGEDIANTSTENSNRCTDEDKYEDSFINDDEPEFLASSPVSSGEVDEEMIHVKKRKGAKGKFKRLKKKYESDDSDDIISKQQNVENDSDDDFIVSLLSKDKVYAKNVTPKPAEKDPKKETVGKCNKRSEDDETCAKTQNLDGPVINSKEKADLHVIEDESLRERDAPRKLPADEARDNVKKSKKGKNEVSDKRKPMDNDCANTNNVLREAGSGDHIVLVAKDDQSAINELKVNHSHDPLFLAAEVGLLRHLKSKKKRKEITDVNDDIMGNITSKSGEDQRRITDEKGDQQHSSLPPFDEGAQNARNLKKGNDGTSDEGKSMFDDTVKASKIAREADSVDQNMLVNKDDQRPINDLEVKNSHDPLIATEEASLQRRSKSKRKRKERADVPGDSTGNEIGVDRKEIIDGTTSLASEDLSAGCQSEEKKLKKKRRKKNKDQEIEENSKINTKEDNVSIAGLEERIIDVRSSRTLSNGLIIDELMAGNSDGKVAGPGKKVKIHYITKLMDTGRVIDDKSSYRFRLGDEQILKGFNVGIDGMRVGAKRRLTIPPSMSSGGQGVGENIPPGSWLECEVEVLSVH